ncbi:MAG: GNAT family N-acetyltransferase [Bacteroidota bacterium]
MLKIISAETSGQIVQVRELFQEYAVFLGFDLCFQGFEAELAGLPGEYAPPGGRLLLALDDDRAAGCVALRMIAADICEMKRLFVRAEFRGRGFGRALTAAIVQEARSGGYSRMRLDTVPALVEAIALYRSLGFREIAPYYPNPIPGALFMELDL